MRSASDEAGKEAAEMDYYRELLRKAIVAGVVGVPVFLLGTFGAMPEISGNGRLFWLIVGAATLFVLVYSGRHFFMGAWKAFRVHNANMDTLIALGTGTAHSFSPTASAD